MILKLSLGHEEIKKEMKRISVCYVLSYRFPDYIRTRTLIKALQNIEDVRVLEARNSSKGFVRYFQTVGKLIVIRAFCNPDYYLLGFRGDELFWIVRLITLGKPLIFDHMMSPYDSLLNERKAIRKGGLIARLFYLYEKATLHCSRMVLTDTDLHREYFRELFCVAPEKVIAIPVGTDEDVFHPMKPERAPDRPSTFEVLFYGSFLPLHGVEVILKAASLLRDLPIHFTLIGGYKGNLSGTHQTIKQLDLQNVTLAPWVELETLPRLISGADLILGGPFGDTGQAHRVVTGKTFQVLAMAKPVIIGESGGNYGFEDKTNCLVIPQGDAGALAQAIDWAFHHRAELTRLGQHGYDLYQSRYSIRQIEKRLRESLFS